GQLGEIEQLSRMMRERPQKLRHLVQAFDVGNFAHISFNDGSYVFSSPCGSTAGIATTDHLRISADEHSLHQVVSDRWIARRYDR
ncbi:hypothetical protein, partial [Agrobacterium pusense]|uniref:hypothetical protein n=1 Tax=Agrobacterium pusense TaxID=648995 RepID=UPI001C6F3083